MYLNTYKFIISVLIYVQIYTLKIPTQLDVFAELARKYRWYRWSSIIQFSCTLAIGQKPLTTTTSINFMNTRGGKTPARYARQPLFYFKTFYFNAIDIIF